MVVNEYLGVLENLFYVDKIALVSSVTILSLGFVD